MNPKPEWLTPVEYVDRDELLRRYPKREYYSCQDGPQVSEPCGDCDWCYEQRSASATPKEGT